MITIQLFGMTKVLAGNQAALSLALGDGNRVKDMVDLLNRLHPPIGELLQKKKVLVSVNQEIAPDDLIIKDGDEVALLPPFAGGCERKWHRCRKGSDT
jgi:molybdopterin converting factor small subunit